MKTFSNQEIVSSVILLAKLSESILILDKIRAEEKTDETMAWFYKNVCCFVATSTIIISALVLLGYRSRHADGWAKAKLEAEEEEMAKREAAEAKKNEYKNEKEGSN